VSDERKKGPVWDMVKNLWKKYEELIRYIIVGGMTTLLSVGLFALAFLLLEEVAGAYLIATTISFAIAVVFAYFANKKAVFHTKTSGARDTAREAGSFFLMRLISYGIDMGMMVLLVEVWHVNELIAKIPVTALIVLLNYVFSKLYIFRKPQKSAEAE